MDAITAALSFNALKSLETASAIQFAVAGKMLDNTRAGGDAVVQLIQAAAGQSQEFVGEALDALGRLDVYA